MWYQFWLINAHFAVEIIVGLGSFVTAWLFIDTWGTKKNKRTLARAFGFILLTVWAVLHATSSDIAVIQMVEGYAKIGGLLLLFVSFAVEYLPKLPDNTERHLTLLPLVPIGGTWYLSPILSALMLLATTLIVVIRVTKGLVKEWREMMLAFILFTFSELVTIFYLWRDTANVAQMYALQEFGPIWFVEHGLRLLAFLLLLRWAWGYIRFRIFPQLFVSYVMIVFVTFLFTTVSFVTLLFQNVEQDQLQQLEVNAQTVEYAVERIQSEAVFATRAAAESFALRSAILSGDEERLYAVSDRLMVESNADFFGVLDEGADVIMQAEDRSKIGRNLSTNPVIKLAYAPSSTASIEIVDGIQAPILRIRAASPILSEAGKVIGVVSAGYILDNAFLDGIKKITGLEVNIFGGEVYSATTVLTPGTTNRTLVGLVESNDEVLSTVLTNSETFVGSISILNTPFYAAYLPIEAVDNEVIGMFSVNRSQIEVLEGMDKTIQSTFVIAVILLLLFIVPVYGMARFINRYQKI